MYESLGSSSSEVFVVPGRAGPDGESCCSRAWPPLGWQLGNRTIPHFPPSPLSIKRVWLYLASLCILILLALTIISLSEKWSQIA